MKGKNVGNLQNLLAIIKFSIAYLTGWSVTDIMGIQLVSTEVLKKLKIK